MRSYKSARDEFVAVAVRDAEKRIGVPPGWCGTWFDVRGCLGERVYWSNATSSWVFKHHGHKISSHNGRVLAIRKAVKYVKEQK